MKKIVALVLSLVMVLGLATTASAATIGKTAQVSDILAEPYFAMWDAELILDSEANEKDSEFAVYTVEMTSKVKNAVIWWAGESMEVVEDKGETEDFEWMGEDEFVVVTAAEADVTVIDGNTITYLALASDYESWDEKATKVDLPVYVAGKETCDTLYAKNAATTTFYAFADTLYVNNPAGSIVFNVDGVAVTASKATVETAVANFSAGEILYVGHDYKLDSKGNTYGEKELTKVYCGVCGTDFKFVAAPESVAVQLFGVDNYDNTYKTWQGQPVWVSTAVVADAPVVDGTATDKVESAETFDAGIAMYVGMSVMAAAGSAVVLKKKD